MAVGVSSWPRSEHCPSINRLELTRFFRLAERRSQSRLGQDRLTARPEGPDRYCPRSLQKA